MPQPALTTPRLRLRPLADDDLELLVDLDSDPEVLRYLHPRARTREEVEQSLARRLAYSTESGLGYWLGFAAGEFVGQWILRPSPDGRGVGEAELGYRLARRWWRQGLASEGSRELLRHGFADVGLVRVVAQTMAVNIGSRAVMTSVGMSYVRSFTETFDDVVSGAEQGEVEYAISRGTWAAALRCGRSG